MGKVVITLIKRSKDRWLAHQVEKEQATLNLICFVFAGGSPSFFAPWKSLLPDWINLIPVLYPMREKRIGDPMPKDIESFVEEFFKDNQRLMDKNIAIWGHCSGCIIGMEYARLICKAGKTPKAFIISGAEAPSQVLMRLKGGNETRDLSELSDEQILRDLSKYQMMEPDMISNETFCKYFIPIFKADLGLFHSYVPKQDPQIDAPALVMNGEDDKSLVWDTVEEWQNYFTSKVEFRKYPGEHYFVNDNRKKIIDDIAEFIKLNGTV